MNQPEPKENAPKPEVYSWGLLPHDSSRDLAAKMSQEPAVIPASEWTDVSLSRYVWHIFDQLDGHCAANAPCAAIMAERRRQGLRDVVLCPEILYARHSRWGTGSTLAENLEYLLEYGVPSRDSCPQKNYGRVSNYLGHDDEAMIYRPLEWLNCAASTTLCGSAIQAGHFLIIGTGAFGRGHSVVACEMEKINGRIWYGGPNSWSAGWNGNGFWRFSENKLRDIAGWGTWALGSVVHDEWNG